MQDDRLFSGTIAENISFFSDDMDLEWAQECARIAGIHSDVAKMPMGYQTIVVEGGVTFSGGQRQRLLLARALYRKPEILILDEATSNVDAAKEREINNYLSRLSITRILVAHRQETIALATKLIAFQDGVFQEIPSEVSRPRSALLGEATSGADSANDDDGPAVTSTEVA